MQQELDNLYDLLSSEDTNNILLGLQLVPNYPITPVVMAHITALAGSDKLSNYYYFDEKVRKDAKNSLKNLLQNS